MNWAEVLLLAVVQGLTEFLPVSSDGHLSLLENIFGWDEKALLPFNVALHIGTLFSLLAYFWRDITNIVFRASCFVFRKGTNHESRITNHESRITNHEDAQTFRLLGLIVLANVPTAIIGFALRDWTEQASASIQLIGFFLCLTGAVLLLSEHLAKRRSSKRELSVPIALLMGVAQGLAVAPGFSRSGSTIGMGLLWGLPKETCARFAFLIAIPAVVGASLLEAKKMSILFQGNIPLLLACIMVAFLVGYLAIDLCLKAVRKGKLSWFALYCFLVGAAALSLTR